MNTVKARPYLHLYDDKHVSGEGTCFDGKGNFCCCISGDDLPKILRISDKRNISILFELHREDIPCGLIVHEDRYYCCCLNGTLYCIDDQGKQIFRKEISYQDEPLKMNDLIFIDDDIYLTDFRGDFLHPEGSVFILRKEDDFAEPIPFLEGLCLPNGIVFQDNEMFISETGRGDILRIAMDENRQIAEQFGIMPIYSNLGKGGGLDSLKISKKEFLYQAVMAMGKVLVLDREGVVSSEILVEGKSIFTPNLAINEEDGYGIILAFGEDGLNLMRFEIKEVQL